MLQQKPPTIIKIS